MKVREIRELSHDEIKSRIDDTRKQLVEMRFALAVRKLESPAKLRTTKRHLAQLLTIQSEKVRAEGEPAKAEPKEAKSKAKAKA
ncbi:MAG TPA: 50S ribosomal protein L29 [Drouetiella sp.]